MNIITATNLRENFANAMKEVKKKDYLLVAKQGKVVSAIVDIDLFEDLLALSSNKYLASIKKAREEVKHGLVYTHDEAFGEL